MLTKLPIIGSAVTYRDICYAIGRIKDASALERLRFLLSEFTQMLHIYPTNTGIAAFYVLLEALKKISPKKEVILPAYTAGSLIVSVKKAGLIPILCDISLKDFGFNRACLAKTITENTLAIVTVHMFGLPVEGIEQLRTEIPSDIFFIEDCAQAMGSKISGRNVGSFGDTSFFSFNRGKNLPVCSGGFIATANTQLSELIVKEMEGKNNVSLVKTILKTSSLPLATNRFIYALGFPVISRFKETIPPKDFNIEKMNNFQLNLIELLFQKREKLFSKRHDNGMLLFNGLKGNKNISLPGISENIYPVFNRFPVLFADVKNKEKAKKQLWDLGIETSFMYMKPLHHMFDLGYNKKEFPDAVYCAGHLLTLPVHHLVSREDLKNIISVIEKL